MSVTARSAIIKRCHFFLFLDLITTHVYGRADHFISKLTVSHSRAPSPGHNIADSAGGDDIAPRELRCDAARAPWDAETARVAHSIVHADEPLVF